MRVLATIAVLALVSGCDRPEAPSELGDLALFFFDEAEVDALLLADGLDNMGAILAEFDFEGADGDRTFETPQLDPTGLSPIPEGVRWENQNPVGGAGRSVFPILTTVTTARLEDQRPVQSESSVRYDREFVTDVECFIARECETLEVVNHITKESPIATLPYDLPMTYRWIELEDGRLGYFIRGWMRERSKGGDDAHWFDQNYHSELWVEDPDDSSRTLRWLNVWSSVTIPGVSDTFAANQVELAIHDAYERADEWLAEQ
jgi:hypothetical protein